MRIRRAGDLCCPSTLLIFLRSLPRIDAALPSPPLAHAHCCNPPFIFLYSKVVCTLILYLSTDHSKNFPGLSHRKRRASPLVSHAFFSFSRPATVPYLVSRTHVFVLPSRLEHLRSSHHRRTRCNARAPLISSYRVYLISPLSLRVFLRTSW
jgi:hypothetical protein